MAIGHEAVLLATYRELGLDDAQILDWIGSPAHFPWTWMGNTNRWGGPVPADWIDRHLALARRVLARQRELGMSPVLPGFAGHIPAALATATARANASSPGSSTGVSQPCHSTSRAVAVASAAGMWPAKPGSTGDMPSS